VISPPGRDQQCQPIHPLIFLASAVGALMLPTNTARRSVLLGLTIYGLSLLGVAEASGCSGGGGAGCLAPVGKKWDRWDMKGSTYQYCYPDENSCPMAWLFNNSKQLPATFGGVTGVDH
jgi:hypothetical protein